MLGIENSNAKAQRRGAGRGRLQQVRRLRFHQRAKCGPAGKRQQPGAACLGGFVSQRTGDVFLDRGLLIPLALFDRSGLISKRSWIPSRSRPLRSCANAEGKSKSSQNTVAD